MFPAKRVYGVTLRNDRRAQIRQEMR